MWPWQPRTYKRLYPGLSKSQLKMGERVELEHTSNPLIARRIAADHLKEFPDYYTRLGKMEREAKKYWRGKK